MCAFQAGTLLLQARTNSQEPWHTVNSASYSSDLGYLEALEQLEHFKFLYLTDRRMINQELRIYEELLR